MGDSSLTCNRTCDETVIIRAKSSSSRNLLIRAAAYDAVYQSVVIPAQELKDIQKEIEGAKLIKLGAAADVRESRMNPDSSSGLYVTAKLRAAARRVATLKEQDKREKAEQAVRTASKMRNWQQEREKHLIEPLSQSDAIQTRVFTTDSPAIRPRQTSD